MTDDFIEMDTAALQRQFAEINKKLTNIDTALRNDIMDSVLREAAGQLQAEQKRILSTAPSDSIMEFNAPITLITISKIKNRLESILETNVDIVHGPLQDDDMIEIENEIEVYKA